MTQQTVLNDLHGPLDGEHEEFGREDPLDRYSLGRLARRGELVEPDTQDDLADAEAGELVEDDLEPSAGRAGRRSGGRVVRGRVRKHGDDWLLSLLLSNQQHVRRAAARVAGFSR